MGYLEVISQLDGLSDVSATCLIDVSASDFSSLFSFEFDVSNMRYLFNTLKPKIAEIIFKNFFLKQKLNRKMPIDYRTNAYLKIYVKN